MAINIALHIKDLLYDNGSVTIADLGTIISEYHSAELNHAEAKIYPPGYKYIFEAKLSESDGVLEKTLSEEYQLSKDQIGHLLSRYTDQIKLHLKEGKQVLFKGIGQLVLNNNKLELIANDSTTDPHSEFLPVIDLKPVRRAEAIKLKPVETKKKKDSRTTRKETSSLGTTIDSKKVEAPKPKKTTSLSQVKPAVEKSGTQKNIEKPKEAKPNKSKGNFTKVLLVSLLLGFILALVGGWFYLKDGSSKTDELSQNSTEIVDSSDQENKEENSSSSDEPKVEQSGSSNSPAVTASKDCAVIVGVFGDVNNISRLKTIIESGGYRVFEKGLKTGSTQLGIFTNCDNYNQELKFARDKIDGKAFFKKLN